MELGVWKTGICFVFFFDIVCGFGKDGKIVLCVFIPIIAFLFILVLLHRLWHWYQQKLMEPEVYDPYLDKMIQDIYPPRISPPWCTGHVINFVPKCHRPAPASRFSRFGQFGPTTHYGKSVVDNPASPAPLVETLHDARTKPPKRSSQTSLAAKRDSAFSVESAPVFSSKTDLCRKMSTMDVSFSEDSSRIIVEQLPTKGLAEGLNYILLGKDSVTDQSKLPRNPYGEDNRYGLESDLQITNNITSTDSPTLHPTSDQKKMKKRLNIVEENTFHVKMNRKRTGGYLTSRELQQSVKVNEQHFSQSVYSLCQNISSDFIVPGEITETFGAVPGRTEQLAQTSSRSCLKGAGRKRRENRCVRFDKECIKRLKQDRFKKKRVPTTEHSLTGGLAGTIPGSKLNKVLSTGMFADKERYGKSATLACNQSFQLTSRPSQLKFCKSVSQGFLYPADLEENVVDDSARGDWNFTFSATSKNMITPRYHHSYVNHQSSSLFEKGEGVGCPWPSHGGIWKYSASDRESSVIAKAPVSVDVIDTTTTKRCPLSPVLVEAVVHHSSPRWERISNLRDLELSTVSRMHRLPSLQRTSGDTVTTADSSLCPYSGRLYSDSSYQDAVEYLPTVTMNADTAETDVISGNITEITGSSKLREWNQVCPTANDDSGLDITQYVDYGNGDIQYVAEDNEVNVPDVVDNIKKLRDIPSESKKMCSTRGIFGDMQGGTSKLVNGTCIKANESDQNAQALTAHHVYPNRQESVSDKSPGKGPHRPASVASNVSMRSFLTARESLTSDIFTFNE